MYFYIYISVLFYNVYASKCENSTDNVIIKVTDIADVFLTLFNNNNKTYNERIKDLKEKLSKIDSYVVDRDKHAELIRNTSKQNNLNETNFYQALLGQDHFRLLNHTKNLYLTMKEKMNSDDLLRILSERGEEKVRISARRMLTGDVMLKKLRDNDLAETVDKYLGEIAMDYHTFDDKVELSNYWDPKIELEERLQHNQHNGRRLYRGERTNIKYYPFIVSVHVMGKFWCGGSIFWNDLIITSAACLQIVYNNRFYRENPKAITVRVGSNHSRVGGEIIEALEVYFHPAYNPKTLNNNIALIRLRRLVHINYHRAPKLIQISHNDQGIPFTAQVLLLGWGVTKNNANMRNEPLYLQRKFLPIYPATYCKDIYGNKFNPKTMFCAGTVTTGEGACNHDAGGPAILNGKLVGIISYGPSVCGFPDAPTVLTMVGVYADWIETINETMPGYYRFNARTTTTTETTVNLAFAKWKKVEVNNIKRLSPAIFVNDVDYREAEDRGKRMFRARITDRIEKDEPVVKKPEPVEPITSTSHSKVYDDWTNAPILLTKRQVKHKNVQVDEANQKQDIKEGYQEEDRQENEHYKKKENINGENKNQYDDNDKAEEVLTSSSKLPLDHEIDEGQYIKQNGKLMQQLLSLTGLTQENEPDENGNKQKGLFQESKLVKKKPKTKAKSDTYDIQATIDDDITHSTTKMQNDDKVEEPLIENIYPEKEETREINALPEAVQEEDTDNNNLKSTKRQFRQSADYRSYDKNKLLRTVSTEPYPYF